MHLIDAHCILDVQHFAYFEAKFYHDIFGADLIIAYRCTSQACASSFSHEWRYAHVVSVSAARMSLVCRS